MTLMLKGMGYLTAAFALAIALAPVDSARADVVTYTYVGADFTNAHAPFTTQENLTGTITFAGPLAANLNGVAETPVAFSFTAGPETITNLTYNPASSFSRLNFYTDSFGNLTGWDIQVAFGGGGQINIENFNSIIGPNVRDQATDSGSDFASVTKAGQFTIAAAVPEPSTWAMMILGFCGLGFMTLAARHQRVAPPDFLIVPLTNLEAAFGRLFRLGVRYRLLARNGLGRGVSRCPFTGAKQKWRGSATTSESDPMQTSTTPRAYRILRLL